MQGSGKDLAQNYYPKSVLCPLLAVLCPSHAYCTTHTHRTKTHCKGRELEASCAREKQGLEMHVGSRNSSPHHPAEGRKLFLEKLPEMLRAPAPAPTPPQAPTAGWKTLPWTNPEEKPTDPASLGSPVKMPAYCSVKVNSEESSSPSSASLLSI